MVFQGRRGKFTLISLHTFESVWGKKWTFCMESSSSLLDKALNYLGSCVHYPKENWAFDNDMVHFFSKQTTHKLTDWRRDWECRTHLHKLPSIIRMIFSPCFFLALWPNRNRGKLCFEILYHIAQHFSSEKKYMIHKATESFRRNSFQNIVYSYFCSTAILNNFQWL